jgi:hypothetical protein
VAVLAKRAVETHKKQGFPVAIVTDGRFENERDRLREALQARSIRIYSARVDGMAGSHASETSFPPDEKIDWVIDNDGDLDALRVKVRDAAEVFGWI